MSSNDTDRIDNNIKKIENWFNEEGITDSRKKSLENSMSDMVKCKRMIEGEK